MVLLVAAIVGAATTLGGAGRAAAQVSATPVALPTATWVPKAFASSTTDVVARAIDGSLATRWSSGKPQASGQTFELDMGKPQTFNKLTMDAGSTTTDYPRGFDVRTSKDGLTWSAPVATANGSGQTVSASFPFQTARYVRVTLTKSATNWWAIHEVTVFGLVSAFTPVALSRSGWSATASLTCPDDFASHVLDGAATTRWSPGVPQAKGQWLQIDMKTARVFERILLDSGVSSGDYARGFDVAVSSDGTNFGAPIASGSGTGQAVSISFPAQTARYVRVTLNKSATNWWSVHELHVFGFGSPVAPIAGPGIEPVPGYTPGSYGCEAGLVLGAKAVDSQGTYYQSVGYAPAGSAPAPGPSCRGGVRFCDANENPVASPTEATLNAAASSTGKCPAIATGDQSMCGVDPASINKTCATSSDCAAGEVCALACESASCTAPTKKCGRLYASCGGIPAESSFCDPTDYRICAEAGAVGQVTTAQLDQQMPTQSALSSTIKVGPLEKKTIPPFDPLPKGYCAFQDVPLKTDKIQTSLPSSELGNKQWGVFGEFFGEQRMGLNREPNWWEDGVEVGGSGGLRAGAYVLGQKITAVSGQVDIVVSDCRKAIGATVKVFGDAVATIDTIDGASTGFGPLTRQEDRLMVPEFMGGDCTRKFDDRNNQAGLMRTAMFSARNVKEFYLDKGVTADLCNRTNKALGKSFKCDDPNLGKNIDVINAWSDEYQKAVETFRTTQNTFELTRNGLSFSLQKGFLALGGKPYTIGAASTMIPVGPVTITLAIEAFGNLFLNGGFQIGASYNGSLLQGLQDLTPYGGLLGEQGDVAIAVGPFFTPGVGLSVAAFAGVGIPGVSIGIEGFVNMFSLSFPIDARIGVVRQAVADTRDVQASAYAGPTLAGVTQIPKKWNFSGAFGLRLKLSALDGQLDAAVRIRVLFARKTFRKLLFRWKGLINVDKVLVGGSIGEPLKHRDDLGIYASRIAFTGVEPVTAADVPRNPDPSARLIGNLTGERCVPIVE